MKPRFKQFDSCFITIDIPEQEVREGDRCVLLDEVFLGEGYSKAWIVEVMSPNEPYKDDSRSNWTPTVLEDHLLLAVYE